VGSNPGAGKSPGRRDFKWGLKIPGQVESVNPGGWCSLGSHFYKAPYSGVAFTALHSLFLAAELQKEPF